MSKVEFDTKAAVGKRLDMLKLAQFALDQQVIADSNYYCPYRKGYLQDSAVINSRPGTGLVVWATPYASRLYYHPEYHFSKDKNPNARGKWFEWAKSVNLEKWRKIAEGKE